MRASRAASNWGAGGRGAEAGDWPAGPAATDPVTSANRTVQNQGVRRVCGNIIVRLAA